MLRRSIKEVLTIIEKQTPSCSLATTLLDQSQKLFTEHLMMMSTTVTTRLINLRELAKTTAASPHNHFSHSATTKSGSILQGSGHRSMPSWTPLKNPNGPHSQGPIRSIASSPTWFSPSDKDNDSSSTSIDKTQSASTTSRSGGNISSSQLLFKTRTSFQDVPPRNKQERELHAVNTAVMVNSLILVSKLGVWGITSSGALLAEALHSCADIVNQLLLRAGVQQSRRAPTRQHPYGYGREKYVYALISAVGVFCLGAGASVVHGIQSILDPPVLENMAYSVWVLLGSAAAEAYSLRVALQSVRTNALEQNIPFWQFIKRGNDPTTVSILAEDAGAVAGLGVAGVSSYLTWITGNPLWDAFGSITIGVLMGGIAVGLIKNNKRFLIGQALRPETEAAIVRHLKADPMVLSVIDPKSEAMADGVYRFKAEVQWNGDRIMHQYLNSLGRDSLYSQIRNSACSTDAMDPEVLSNAMDLAMMEVGRGVIRTVGEEIDRLENELQQLVPGLKYVDLETDRGKIEQSTLECPVTDEVSK